MSFDLALGPTQDLILGANHDAQGISGTELYDQRIKTRLKIRRGSWVFDPAKRLGSRIETVLGQPMDQAATEITAFVHEALDDMADVVVQSVNVEADPNNTIETSLIITVGYTLAPAIVEAPLFPSVEELQEIAIVFQF